MDHSTYTGRFAPSPSGPLHLGSLFSALSSWLQARSRQGRWLLRIEDIDTPRVVEDADSAIMRTLESFGLTWDEAVVYQSQRLSAYDEALASLKQRGLVFHCTCSRKEVAAGHKGADGPVYPGTCRNGPDPLRARRAVRVLIEDTEICFQDRLYGQQGQHLGRDVGDFIIRRSDGQYAYQLAVVVDDAWQGVTEVVRGEDILSSTCRQIYLQRLLGYPQPKYFHTPLLINTAGRKLSKQNHALPVDDNDVVNTLRYCLHLLNHPAPQDMDHRDDLLAWAIAAWHPEQLPHEPLTTVHD